MLNYSPARSHRGLISLFVRHPVAANLLMILMILAGVWTLMGRINISLFPPFNLDAITINVIWTGASAEDVQEAITIPLEQEVRNVDGLKKMTATSQMGASIILMEFHENTNINDSLEDVKQRISLVRANLPADAEEPEIYKNIFYESIARVLVYGPKYIDELRPWVRDFEQELLNRGIARIDITGLPEEEIAIQVPIERLDELNMSLSQVADRVEAMSRDFPAGVAGRWDVSKQLRSLQQQRDVQGFRSLPIMSDEQGRHLTLDDIATIEQRPKEGEPLVFYQGRPAVELLLQRMETGNTLASARIMRDWLADVQPSLPPDIRLKVYDENWVYLEERIRLLLNNGASGMVLILIILFTFLNGRVAFWVAAGIPVAFMATIAVIYLFGGSINMISLFALIMALGIIVDDTIVVSEDTLTHLSKGENVLEATESGAYRMLSPVMASSLTTIATFVPLLLIGGTMGNILFAIPATIICVILASLLECFLVLPGHLRHGFRNPKALAEGKFRKKVDALVDKFREGQFRRFITLAVQRPYATIAIAFSFLIVMFGLLVGGRLPFTFFPSPEGTLFMADVQFTAGTSPETVKQFLFEVENVLYQANDELKAEYNDEEILVTDVIVQKVAAALDPAVAGQRGDQYGYITVELTTPDSRHVRNQVFVDRWRSLVKTPAGIESFAIREVEGGPPGEDIDIQLGHSDPMILKTAALELEDYLRQYAGVNNVRDNLPFGQDELVYTLTPEAKGVDLTVQSVGQQLRDAFDGRIAQTFYQGIEEVEVRVVLPDDQRHRLSSLNELPIITPNGHVMMLSNAVHFTHQQGLERLLRTNNQLTVHVTASVDASVTNANQVLLNVNQNFLPNLKQRYGVNVSFEGTAAEQEATFVDMQQGLIFAFVLIYIILAWVFGSYYWPFAVMLAIPFGLGGALFGHWVMGLNITILSLFGFFGLSGIIINNSIILISFYKELRNEGLAVEHAIVEASCQRLRAVFLTSVTTIAGLTPLLFETSLQAQFLIPMAASIAFGLGFGTLLVLAVVPAFLCIQERRRSA